MASLRAQFAKGATWTTAETYGSAALNFFFVAWQARLLVSSDFGVAAAASVVTLFFFVLIDALAATVIQHQDATSGQLSTLFWLTLGVLSALYLVIFLAAPLLADAANMPALAAVFRVACLQLPLLGLLVVPLALLRGQLRFRELALCQLAASLGAGGVAIALALRGAGYWALVVQGLLLIALRCALLWPLSAFKPRSRVQIVEAAPLLRYARGLIGFTIVNYWSRNLDIVLIGRVFGAQPLGYYSLAVRSIGMPVQLATGALRPILHPTFVAMDGDEQRIRRAYLRLVRVTALVTLPAGALLWFGADAIVHVVWGNGWEPVANILRGLALLAAVQPVNALSAAVYMATGATSLLFRLSLLNAAVTIAAIATGLNFGVAGVAWAISLAYALVVAPISSGAALNLLHGKLRELVTAIMPGTLVAGILLAVALALRAML